MNYDGTVLDEGFPFLAVTITKGMKVEIDVLPSEEKGDDGFWIIMNSEQATELARHLLAAVETLDAG